MGEQVIVLTDLTKKYGNFTAVDHISLSICKGEIFGLLGPNGAGIHNYPDDAGADGADFRQSGNLWNRLHYKPY